MHPVFFSFLAVITVYVDVEQTWTCLLWELVCELGVFDSRNWEVPIIPSYQEDAGKNPPLLCYHFNSLIHCFLIVLT